METTPETYPYVEEGEEVQRGRLKLGGTSAVLDRPLPRGTRVTLIVEADVDTVSHLPFEKLLTRQHHGTAAAAYVVDRDAVAGVIAEAAKRDQAIEDRLEGVQQLPFADDEAPSDERRVGLGTPDLDAAERRIAERAAEAGATSDGEPAADDAVDVLEELEELTDAEISDRLAELSPALRKGLAIVAGPSGATDRATSGRTTARALGQVRGQELNRLAELNLVRAIDGGVDVAGMTHELTPEGRQVAAALPEGDA